MHSLSIHSTARWPQSPEDFHELLVLCFGCCSVSFDSASLGFLIHETSSCQRNCFQCWSLAISFPDNFLNVNQLSTHLSRWWVPQSITHSTIGRIHFCSGATILARFFEIPLLHSPCKSRHTSRAKSIAAAKDKGK